jgi:co-chaperonin GroES (HSP10)
MRIIPIGSRVFVRLIPPVFDLEARAAAAGLAIVVDEADIPKPTEGVVVAVGSDPLIQELCAIGDTVLFSKFAGLDVMVEGISYRSIELREIVACIKPNSPSESTSPTAPQEEPLPRL